MQYTFHLHRTALHAEKRSASLRPGVPKHSRALQPSRWYHAHAIAYQSLFSSFLSFFFWFWIPSMFKPFSIDAVDALNALLDRLMKEYSDLILLLARNPTSDQVRLFWVIFFVFDSRNFGFYCHCLMHLLQNSFDILLNISINHTYILFRVDPQRLVQLETIKTVFINIHHIINTYRPHQVRVCDEIPPRKATSDLFHNFLDFSVIVLLLPRLWRRSRPQWHPSTQPPSLSHPN